MKAVTEKQPWASLIVEGIKDIENRTWKTNFSGRILVHAAAKPANIKYEIEGQNCSDSRAGRKYFQFDYQRRDSRRVFIRGISFDSLHTKQAGE